MSYDFETERSRELAERLQQVLPGGDTRTGTFYDPYPLAIVRGSGYRLWDIDGNEFIDCLNNFTSLVHGNVAPAIVEALRAQAELGTAFGAPHELQAEVAERIRDRVASVEQVRFTNSGSEAIMLAVRAARAFTGRSEIVKAHGGYHGFWEQVPMTFGSPGIPEEVRGLVHEVDFNDEAGLANVMAEHGDRIAALIVEPVMTAAGVIEGTGEFLSAAHRLADKNDALLILDEIVTLRLDHGGYQAVVGLRPDLTAFGKIIGGGLPVGAVGGRADVLAIFDPRRPDHIVHSGTFNGNAVTLAAGRASLDLLTEDEIARINALGSRLARRLSETIPEAVITSCGSLIQLHFETGHEIRRYRDTNIASETLARFHHAALAEGVMIASRGLLNLSTAMDEAVVDDVADRLARAASRIGSPLTAQA
ncbi:MAG: aspartate aminotransferase family protein [Gaiellaceae bacterium]